MTNIAVIGSSGSIGKQVLNVVRKNPDKFNIVSLVINSNLELLSEQVQEFSPAYVGICDNNAYAAGKDRFGDIKVFGGSEALTFSCELEETDIIVVSVVGMSGLPAVISAIENNKTIALANKESLVAAGEIILSMISASDAKIIPIDSEHSAIWQCLSGGRKEDVNRLILTASGGPFFGYTREMLDKVTIEEAVNHPTWRMGRKISVDSATMMNKALEIIEAKYLFGVDRIDYLIHRESIIHSIVEYKDGAMLAQMSNATMEIPIQLALSYPARYTTDTAPFAFDRPLTFGQPDETVFPAPRLAYQSLSMGGTAPCVLNAANEACVRLFLGGKIKFTDIYDLTADMLNKYKIIKNPSINDIFDSYNEIVEIIISKFN